MIITSSARHASMPVLRAAARPSFASLARSTNGTSGCASRYRIAALRLSSVEWSSTITTSNDTSSLARMLSSVSATSDS